MSSTIRTLTLFAALTSAAPALAGTKYVDAALASGANDGSSWANAYQGADGLQAALATSVAGDEIWVANGTYRPTSSGARNVYFVPKNGVALYGGFAGGESSLAQRDWVANVAVLSGDLAGNDGSGIYTDNSYHVINANSTNATAVVDGFRVTGGNANGAGANQDRGGGILCLGAAQTTVRNCNFIANRCTFGGGAGYINSSAPTFTNCNFESNLGGSFGGAFDMATSVTAVFDRCTFKSNQAARAGAIEIFGSSNVKVYNSMFVLNTASGAGGGGAIFISGSNPQIRNCNLIGNGANSHVTGGILVSSGSPSIANCIIETNFGSAGSGALAQVNPATANVTYSVVPTGHTGTGNIALAPQYQNCGPTPFALHPLSPGVDAGNNASLPASATLDLLGSPRFLDQATVADTGSGTAPIVDIGAYEVVDCNANNIGDACDIQNGAPDTNQNGVLDQCECIGGTAPTVYCTSKLNSQFCLPAIGFSGNPSASNAQPFLITATNILNQKSGLLFYGYQSQGAPFQGGWLCVLAPIRRTSVQSSGGSPTGTDCTGTFSFDFNAYIQTGFDSLIQVPGQQVYAQFWSRDPQDAFFTNLTNGLQFAVCQ
jgi:hypothetical protein